MKKMILFMAAVLCTSRLLGQMTNGFVVPQPGNNLMVYTNGYISTNVTGGTAVYTNVWSASGALNHNIEAGVSTVGTNTITGSLDNTLDGANWTTLVNGAALTNTAPYRTNYIGKVQQFRWRISLAGTNASYFWNYMSQ